MDQRRGTGSQARDQRELRSARVRQAAHCFRLMRQVIGGLNMGFFDCLSFVLEVFYMLFLDVFDFLRSYWEYFVVIVLGYATGRMLRFWIHRNFSEVDDECK